MQTPTDTDNTAYTPQVSNLVFYLPFAYYYKVRLRTTEKLLSWVLIYLMPTAWYSWYAAGELSWLFCINYLFILIAAFTLYETGYIHNDTFTTRHEKVPTLRLSEENLRYFYSHCHSIFLSRILTALVLLTALLILNGFSAQILLTSLSIVLIPCIFYLYNHCRNKYNVLLYPVLVFSRYIPFMLPYSPSWQLVLLLFLSFPCCNMLERFSMPKQRFPVFKLLIPTEKSKTYFRIAYYIIILAVLLPFFSIMQLVPVIILAIYRCLVAILLLFYHPKRYLQ